MPSVFNVLISPFAATQNIDVFS